MWHSPDWFGLLAASYAGIAYFSFRHWRKAAVDDSPQSHEHNPGRQAEAVYSSYKRRLEAAKRDARGRFDRTTRLPEQKERIRAHWSALESREQSAEARAHLRAETSLSSGLPPGQLFDSMRDAGFVRFHPYPNRLRSRPNVYPNPATHKLDDPLTA